MRESLAQILARYRFAVLIAAALLTAVAGYGARHLALSTDMEVFFQDDDPELLAYNAVRDTYTRDDNLFLVFDPADGNVFTPDNLAIVERLTEQAWTVPHAIRVDSITNFQHTEAAGDDLTVRPLVEDGASLGATEIARVREIATNEPLLRGKLVTPTGEITAINITINLPGVDRSHEIPEAVEAVRAMREDLRAAHPGSDLKITGKVAGNNAFTEAALYDVTHIIPTALAIALLCISAYLYLASRSVVTAISATLATIIVIFLSVGVAMGAAGWLGFELTPPAVNAPTIILTLAVADCMHLLVTFFQSRRRGLSAHAAMTHSLRLNFQAVALTSVTTIIGFLALNASDAPPFRDLGNIVAMGIAAAWLFSITLLPALMVILPMKVHVEREESLNAMSRIASAVLERPRTSLAITVVLIVSAASFLPKNQLYDVWAEYFDTRTQIRQDSDFARARLNGFNTLEFSLAADGSGGIADPAYLQTLEDFANWLRSQPEVAHVSTFTDVMKRLNRNMHGDDNAWYRLPDDRELAAQYLLLYEFSLPFGLDLTNQVNMDKSATRLIAGIKTSSTLDILNLQERARAWQRANAPAEFYHPGASSDSMFAHVGQRNLRSMWLGSAMGLVAISIVIAIALRSPLFGVLSLLLNVLPLLVGFGIWGLLVGRIGLGLSVVSGLTMGIVVDYTVHLLSKYNMARREQQLAVVDAIRYAFSTVGVALVVTTIVLCVNFGLFAFSVFKLNSEMGTLTAGIILIALVIDFLFLPPLLLFLSRKDRAATDEPAIATA